MIKKVYLMSDAVDLSHNESQCNYYIAKMKFTFSPSKFYIKHPIM